MKHTPHINIGTTFKHGYEEPVVFPDRERRHHTYVIGQTGVGKSTLLRNIILQDIEAGKGVGVVDPHGDLADSLLDAIPPHRTRDVVYFNATDEDYPIGFNILGHVEPNLQHLAASGAVETFKAIWSESWGPRLEYILYATVAGLMESQNVTLLGINRMLTDDVYRVWVVKRITDPAVRSFWLDEFDAWDNRFRTEAIAPIQNKVGRLLMSAPLRNILGQVKNRFDPLFIMDNKRIFIANLSKGHLGHDKSSLLGALLVNGFQLAAMQRAKYPDHEREDFFLAVDEFQSFATGSFASILSEARKYHLSLTLAHQFIEQVPAPIRQAVFGNVGTMIAFRTGEADSHVLARQIGHYRPEHFAGLENHEAVVKRLDGTISTCKSAAPTETYHGHRDILIAESRGRFATPRTRVEDKIGRWISGTSDAAC